MNYNLKFGVFVHEGVSDQDAVKQSGLDGQENW